MKKLLNTVKTTILSSFTGVVRKTAYAGAGLASRWGQHQPKLPKELMK